ncbi:hypothetical protein Brsp06_03467 [Brucella sp. NBRC 13694]|uniref:hypothetical protein n=1 Tax=Brucella sp. NBRC 13694 TaxID=3075482 RepID=UPI003095D048
MDKYLVSQVRRQGTGRYGDVRYTVYGYHEKYATLSFSANYGGGTSNFSIWIEPVDFETLIKGMLETDRDAAVLAIGKALATTFEPKDIKE